MCVGIFKTFHWNLVGILETSLLILLELCSILYVWSIVHDHLANETVQKLQPVNKISKPLPYPEPTV